MKIETLTAFHNELEKIALKSETVGRAFAKRLLANQRKLGIPQGSSHAEHVSAAAKAGAEFGQSKTGLKYKRWIDRLKTKPGAESHLHGLNRAAMEESHTQDLAALKSRNRN